MHRQSVPLAPAPFEQPVYVTRPLMPPLESYTEILQGAWERRWLTNKGQLHDALEDALCRHLRVEHLSLVNNGTSALILLCRALGLAGEVVTTPFTFAATVNALIWCGLTPVFADIDPVRLTVDPEAVERAITPGTAAILGVHVYGMPCEVEVLQSIADRHGLPLIYDGAHTFGAEIAGEPVLNFGDATILSFHATKLFTTAEGGAVVVKDRRLKDRIDLLKNLGINDEVTVVLPGINARMNELQAALGLANLPAVAEEQRLRSELADVYRARLRGIDGLNCFEIPSHVRDSRCYFVIRIDGERCRLSRDDLYERLKAFNVFARRYFYPLCSAFPFTRHYPSSRQDNLRVAHRVAEEVLCLPFFSGLGAAGVHRICDIVHHLLGTRHHEARIVGRA